jgi:hypothetical protein
MSKPEPHPIIPLPSPVSEHQNDPPLGRWQWVAWCVGCTIIAGGAIFLPRAVYTELTRQPQPCTPAADYVIGRDVPLRGAAMSDARRARR